VTLSARTASVWLRVVFGILGVAAVALFLALFALTQFGDNQPVVLGAFSAGALPAATAVYFWLYRRERRAFGLGIGAVLLAVAVHYIVFAVLAHASTSAGFIAAAIEFAICAAILTSAHRHLQRTATSSRLTLRCTRPATAGFASLRRRVNSNV
jgi:hypothetical protein